MNVSDKAVHNFINDSYNCSEGIVAAVCDHYSLDKDSLVAASTAFGGGIGSSGNICGALTGGLMMLGVLAKEKNLTKPEIREKAKDLFEGFEKKFSYTDCLPLTNHSCTRSEEEFDIKHCAPYIKWVVNEITKNEN